MGTMQVVSRAILPGQRGANVTPAVSARTRAPAVPASMASMSDSAPITAGFPVALAKSGSTSTTGEQRRERFFEGEPVPQFLLDEVTDHSLRLGAEHVERSFGYLLVGCPFQGQQSDLGAVPTPHMRA